MAGKKTQNFNVREFKFNSLVPREEGASEGISTFEFQELDAAAHFTQNISQETIRSEREAAEETGFNFLPKVREYRGLKEQEERDLEARIQAEVQKRFEEVKQAAYEEGYNAGHSEGVEKAYAEASENLAQQIEEFGVSLAELNASKQAIYDKSREEAYQMVKNLSKWVILKEVDEKYYLVRLLEKLIHEINTKSNLVVRVNEASFGHMPEVVKIVERTLGKLTNLRLEIDHEQSENGIILESENTIIDGSFAAQMKSIDKIFETVGLND
ncbi:MAG: hypothetical protein CME62_14520 [Halobacteriovoraceae bacterium]|nr:hypothetical protein [Halobacteriovoraceae bacterium]|tara:strand:- start:112 stop:921 length:810 start_codon:yes stop_codon:yes gene_type:complete